MSKIRGMGSRCIEIVPCAFDGVTISASDNNNGHACPSFTPAQTREIIAALQDAGGGEGAWGSARCREWLHEHCDVVQVVMRERSAIVRPVEVVLPGAVGWAFTGTGGTAATVGDLREAVHNAATALGITCPLGEACPVDGCPPVADPDDWLRMCRSRCWDCCSCARGGECSNYAKREESGGGA